MTKSLVFLILLLAFALLALSSMPAAIINGKIILLGRVNDYLHMYQSAVASNTDYDFGSPAGRADLAKQKQAVLQKLIDNQIIADLAKKQGVSVSAKELDRYYDFLLHKFGIAPGQNAVEIKRKFAATESKFKALVVRPDLLEIKLRISRLSQENAAGLKTARNIRKKLTGGLAFADAARQFSDDEASRFIGGDIGFAARDDLLPWVADVVFGLDVGEVGEIVVSGDGYYIFQVAGKDDKSDPPRLQARQIFIRDESFDGFLRQEREKSRIYIFGKI